MWQRRNQLAITSCACKCFGTSVPEEDGEKANIFIGRTKGVVEKVYWKRKSSAHSKYNS